MKYLVFLLLICYWKPSMARGFDDNEFWELMKKSFSRINFEKPEKCSDGKEPWRDENDFTSDYACHVIDDHKNSKTFRYDQDRLMDFNATDNRFTSTMRYGFSLKNESLEEVIVYDSKNVFIKGSNKFYFLIIFDNNGFVKEYELHAKQALLPLSEKFKNRIEERTFLLELSGFKISVLKLLSEICLSKKHKKTCKAFEELSNLPDFRFKS